MGLLGALLCKGLGSRACCAKAPAILQQLALQLILTARHTVEELKAFATLVPMAQLLPVRILPSTTCCNSLPYSVSKAGRALILARAIQREGERTSGGQEKPFAFHFGCARWLKSQCCQQPYKWPETLRSAQVPVQ